MYIRNELDLKIGQINSCNTSVESAPKVSEESYWTQGFI